MDIVSINGAEYKASEAKISVYDRGFLYGDQCSEQIRAYHGIPFQLKRHLERLENSIHTLKFPEINLVAIEKEIKSLLSKSELEELSIRVSVSRGDSSEGFRAIKNLSPNIVIIISEYHPLPYEFTAHGVAVITGMIKRLSPESWPLNVKNTNLNNIMANLEAQEAGVYETIMLNSEGYLTEGTTSNLFWIKDDELYTPADYLGILPGITRELVFKLAEKLGLRVSQGEYFPEELAEADEAFLTNAMVEILPINKIDGHQITGGTIGRHTGILRESYHQLVSSETL